jgi:hypothetical protein
MATLQQFSWVDYLLVSLLLVALGIGWARGLIQVLTGFLVFVVTTFIAGRYTTEVTAFLNRWWGVQTWLARFLERRLNFPPEAHRVPAGQTSWLVTSEWLKTVPLPTPYKQALAQRLADWSHTAGNQTPASFIIHQLAGAILTAIVFMVLAGVLGWLLGWLSRFISDQIEEIPLMGTLNRMLGAVAVLLQWGATIALFIGLVVPVLSLHGLPQLGRAIENAYLAPYFLHVYDGLRHILFGLYKGGFFGF